MSPRDRDAVELASLCSLDVLPAKCSLEAEVHREMVRFRAINRSGEPSSWSGWFSLSDAPITLVWRAFDWPSGTLPI